MLPVPADDARQTSLADNVIARRRADRRRCRGRGFDVGYHGRAQGRDAHRVGVDRQRRSHAPPARRPRPVAACVARLSRRRAAGAGAQRCRGYDAGRGVCRVRRGRIGLRCRVNGVGRRYASLVAAQLDKALRDPAAAAALASLDAVLIGGGPMPHGVAERASAARISVVRTYGMSETAGGCVYDGVALDGVRVRDRSTAGWCSAARRWRRVTATPVQPDPFAEPGWFRTDDIGAVDDSGVLRVLGRVDDAISTGGLTVLPQLVEAALAPHPAVADCAVFGVAGRTAGPASGRGDRGGRRRVRHPRWPSCARTSLQRCRRRPRRERCISSTSCPAAASARWTGANSPRDSVSGAASAGRGRWSPAD